MMAKRKKSAGDKTLFWLIVVLAISLLVGVNRAWEGIGGYHGWNEAYYSNKASSVLEHPFKYPSNAAGNLFTSPPPLYDYLLASVYLVFGVNVLYGRLLSILFSLAALTLTFTVADLIYGRREALLASALAAFAPAHVLVGRNIQTDMAVSCFLLASLASYLRWWKRKDRRYLYLACFFVGVGFWIKQITVLFLVSAALTETYLSKGFKWVGRPHLTGLLISAVIIAPFIAYGLVLNSGAFITGSSYLAEGSRSIGGLPALLHCLRELFWGFSPALFILSAYSAYGLRSKRSKQELLLLSMLAVFLLLFLKYNYHSYYLLPMVYPAAVLSSKTLVKIPKRWKWVPHLLLATMLLNSMLLLAASKYGFNGLSTLPRLVGDGKTTVYMSDYTFGSYGEILGFYLPDARLAVTDDLRKISDSGGGSYLLIQRSESENLRLDGFTPLMRDYYGMSAGFLSFILKPSNYHGYAVDNVYTQWGDNLGFGFTNVTSYGEFYLVDLSSYTSPTT
ncbi:MAG: phospholipid carrier-dependent glycosyltransferase [Candidatus Altiarchaeales archaeon]|nr:phospholipid carrier-dependent glycosyltransferase [Candidatus Altiarchaeales archaeon]MBD3416581.1 phospholipid carrier-dependent glycosyltransferase [Candidatus Altiarchaeales archaeon]